MSTRGREGAETEGQQLGGAAADLEDPAREPHDDGGEEAAVAVDQRAGVCIQRVLLFCAAHVHKSRWGLEGAVPGA